MMKQGSANTGLAEFSIDVDKEVTSPILPPSAEDEWLRSESERLTINLGDNIPEPQKALALFDTVKQEMTVIGTMGNIMTIIGQAKVRKTFFILQLVVAALITGTLFGKIVAFLEGKTVLYVDTEQSTTHVMRALKRICAMMRITTHPPNLKVIGLRTKTAEERVKLIEWNIRNTPNLGMVVIDGARDLLYDILCPKEAAITATHLMKWTEIYNLHLVTVLHQNKGDNKARGHIGTELVNKSETVLEVSLDSCKEYSVVTAQQCRDREPEPFAFGIDGEGLPYIIEDYSPEANKANSVKAAGQRGRTAILISDDEREACFQEVFKNTSGLKYAALTDALMTAYNTVSNGKTIGQRKAEGLIKEAKETGQIIQDGGMGFYKLNTQHDAQSA